MDLNNYYYMAFVVEHAGTIMTIAAATVGFLYAIRSKQPHAFSKLKSEIIPLCFFIMVVCAALTLLLVRLNTGLAGSDLLDVLASSNAMNEFDRANLERAFETNRKSALMLDVVMFFFVALAIIEYAAKIIDWFLKSNDNEERSSAD